MSPYYTWALISNLRWKQSLILSFTNVYTGLKPIIKVHFFKARKTVKTESATKTNSLKSFSSHQYCELNYEEEIMYCTLSKIPSLTVSNRSTTHNPGKIDFKCSSNYQEQAWSYRIRRLFGSRMHSESTRTLLKFYINKEGIEGYYRWLLPRHLTISE